MKGGGNEKEHFFPWDKIFARFDKLQRVTAEPLNSR